MLLAILALLAASDGLPSAGTAPAAPTAPAAQTTVLDEARAKLERLGTYRLRFTKEERLEGGWVGPQVMELVVREQPYAVVGNVVAGPNKGRRFLFDANQRKGQLRIREAGLLGVVPLWLDVESKLTRDDTRHPVTALGFGFIFKTIERDMRLAGGRFTIVDEGLDPAGARCLMLAAPQGVRGVYAQRTRLCFAATSLLLTRVEVWDARGPFERFSYEVIDPDVKEAQVFSLEANGL